MTSTDLDALHATQAAARLLGIARRLENHATGSATDAAARAARAAADLLADCMVPPDALSTDALMEVVLSGLRQAISASTRPGASPHSSA